MRIATWNLKRPKGKGRRWTAIEEQLLKVNADVWILTETNQDINLGDGFFGFHALKIDGYHKGSECRTSIWTRLEFSRRLHTHDPETAVCVEIKCDAGQVLVYGTVIPYENAGVKDNRYRSNSVWHVGLKNWDVHLGSIERHRKELSDLRSSHEGRQFVLGGDFNHHRFENSRYGSTGRDKLSESLDELNLDCVTDADFRATGELTTRATVDHICLSPDLLERGVKVEAWESPLLNGKPISDHNGITVDIGKRIYSSLP